MLLETKYLATLLNNPAMKATSEAILDEVWKEQGSIFSLIPEKHFSSCTWNDLKGKPYAALSYQWRQKWDSILEKLLGTDGVEAEYIWIDIFCLNQLDGNRMTTIRKSGDIYYYANEYHLMELGCLFRGWILFELSSAREEPKIHSSITNKKMLQKLKNEFREKGFEGCKFTKPSDMDLVRGIIVEKYTSLDIFNDRVMKIIDKYVLTE